MEIVQKKEALLKELSRIRNTQERFAYIIAQGRLKSPLATEFKTDAYRVEGCLANLWFHPEFRDGKCFFEADSDSAIVKGIATVLCNFYSGHEPAEILTVDPNFLEDAGISQHVTPNRRNSLSKVWDKIASFATSCQADGMPTTRQG